MRQRKKPIILVDCDGVLADLTMLVNSLNRVMKTQIDINKCDKYHLHEIWETSIDVMDKAMNEIEGFFSYEDIEPVKNAISSIRFLQKTFEIKVLTARKPQHETQTKNWIKKHFGGNIEILYAKANANHHGNKAPISKIEVCQKYNAFALIEDNPFELEELIKKSPKIKAICLEMPYNAHLKHNNQILIGNWSKITKYLTQEYAKVK